MKGTSPHFQVTGLMNDTTLLSPISMQGQNEILEGHEQSSRGYGSQNSRANRVEMREERNRNSRTLSRRNPSRIKELQHVVSVEQMDHTGQIS